MADHSLYQTVRLFAGRRDFSRRLSTRRWARLWKMLQDYSDARLVDGQRDRPGTNYAQ